jgi:hypothetical protein
MDIASGTAIILIAVCLLMAGLIVMSEWKRAESDRALEIAMRRMADYADIVAQYDEEITRLENRVIDLEDEWFDSTVRYSQLYWFVISKCLIQRDGKKRWFTKIKDIRHSQRGTFVEVPADPRIPGNRTVPSDAVVYLTE